MERIRQGGGAMGEIAKKITDISQDRELVEQMLGASESIVFTSNIFNKQSRQVETALKSQNNQQKLVDVTLSGHNPRHKSQQFIKKLNNFFTDSDSYNKNNFHYYIAQDNGKIRLFIKEVNI